MVSRGQCHSLAQQLEEAAVRCQRAEADAAAAQEALQEAQEASAAPAPAAAANDEVEEMTAAVMSTATRAGILQAQVEDLKKKLGQ